MVMATTVEAGSVRSKKPPRCPQAERPTSEPSVLEPLSPWLIPPLLPRLEWPEGAWHVPPAADFGWGLDYTPTRGVAVFSHSFFGQKRRYIGFFWGLPRHRDPLRCEQPELPVGADCHSMNVEAGGLLVGHFHDRGRCRHDAQPCAAADPVDVPVTVHHNDAVGQGLKLAHEPVAVDQRRADALRQSLCRPRIFDDMMMQGDDPAGARVLLA